MSIYDIPQDLYFYFLLILGNTCKTFNEKINIYNRKIRAINLPQAFNATKWKKIKNLEVSKLNKVNVATILSHELRLEKLYIKNFSFLFETKSARYKSVCIMNELYLNSKITNRILDLEKKRD